MQKATAIVALAAATALACTHPSPGRHYSIITTPQDVGLQVFLDQWPRYYRIATGINVGFTGSFRELPEDLIADLNTFFPQYEFAVAKMWYTHWGPEDVALIVVTDRASRAVVSYAWAPWFDSSTDPLQSIINQHQWGAYCNGEPVATALARLLAIAGDNVLGPIEKEDFFGASGVVCRMAFPLLSKERPGRATQRVVVEVTNHVTAWLSVEPMIGASSSN